MRHGWSVLGLILAVGCGPDSVDADTDSGSGADEVGDARCEYADFEVPPLDEPDACASYFGDPPLAFEPRDVPLEIVNARDEAVLIYEQGSGCQHAPRWFSLTGSYAEREVWLPLTNCETQWPSCATYSEAPPTCLLCQTFHAPIYIEPGGRFLTTWRAAAALDVELPASCSVAGEATSCWAPTPLPPQTYSLEALGQPASECDLVNCSCTPDADGSCPVDLGPDGDYAVVFDELSLSASLEWSSACNAISLRFE